MGHRRRASRPTLTRLAVGGAVAALALTGCSVANPITTHRDYAASDGVILDVGDVRLGNAIVLTSAEGAAGTLVGYVSNRADDEVEVSIRVADADTTTFRVPGGRTVRLGPDADEAVDVAAVPAAPGSKVEVTLGSGRDGEVTDVVPVMDGTLEEYADLVP